MGNETLAETLRVASEKGKKRVNRAERAEQSARQKEEERRRALHEERVGRYAADMRPFFIDKLTEKAAAATKAGEFTTGIVWRLQRQDDFSALKATMEQVKDHFVEQGLQAETEFWTNADIHGIVTRDGEETHFRPTTEWGAKLDISWTPPQE